MEIIYTSPYLTPKEIAASLRVNVQSVYRLIESGKLRAINISHGKRASYRIDKGDLDDYLAGAMVVKETKQKPRRQRKRRIPVPQDRWGF